MEDGAQLYKHKNVVNTFNDAMIIPPPDHIERRRRISSSIKPQGRKPLQTNAGVSLYATFVWISMNGSHIYQWN